MIERLRESGYLTREQTSAQADLRRAVSSARYAFNHGQMGTLPDYQASAARQATATNHKQWTLI